MQKVGNKTSLLTIWRDMLDLCTVWMRTRSAIIRFDALICDSTITKISRETTPAPAPTRKDPIYVPQSISVEWWNGPSTNKGELCHIQDLNTMEYLQNSIWKTNTLELFVRVLFLPGTKNILLQNGPTQSSLLACRGKSNGTLFWYVCILVNVSCDILTSCFTIWFIMLVRVCFRSVLYV